MMVEIYIITPGEERLLLSQAGPLIFVYRRREMGGGETREARCRGSSKVIANTAAGGTTSTTTTETDEGSSSSNISSSAPSPLYYHWSSFEDYIQFCGGVNPLDALCETALCVDVMLVNKKTGKMAMWYTDSGHGFNYESESPTSPIIDSAECKMVVGQRDLVFSHFARLKVVNEPMGGSNSSSSSGGHSSKKVLDFALTVQVPTKVNGLDYHRLLQSLHWV